MTRTNLYRTLAAACLAAPILAALPACDSTKQATAKDEQRAYWNNTRIGVLYQLATQQYQVGDYDKCRETLKQALALGYPHAPTHILAAKVELEKGSVELAADHLKTAVQIDAANPEPYYLLGVVYQRWQNNQAAHDYYKLAFDKKPAEALYLLALVEMKITLGQLDDAQKLLDDKAVYFEQSAAVRAAQARLAVLRNDYPKAVTYYRDATLLCPEDLHLRQNYAEALYFAGRYSEALPVLEALHAETGVEDHVSVQMLLARPTWPCTARATPAPSSPKSPAKTPTTTTPGSNSPRPPCASATSTRPPAWPPASCPPSPITPRP
jgi:Flp pilus assembly protein TadD